MSKPSLRPRSVPTLCLALLAALCAVQHAAADRGAAPCPLSCSDTVASGAFSTALGLNTTASGNHSTAAGDGCVASGKSATAIGHMTTAGPYSTAMGYKTAAASTGTAFGYFTSATGMYSAAFGNYVGTTERESLIVSGKVHARNIQLFAEDRLAANVTAVHDRAAMLSQLRDLQIAEWSPSPGLCAHRGISAERCASPELRSVGLLASGVEAAMPAAVTATATSLRLTAGRGAKVLHNVKDRAGHAQPAAEESDPPVVEVVDNVRSLDVAALLARMVGSIQALDTQVQARAQQASAQQAQIKQLREELAAHKHTIAMLQQ